MNATIKITHDPELVKSIARAVAREMATTQREPRQEEPGDRLLSISTLMEKFDISKTALYRIRRKDKTFPKPFVLNRGKPRWQASDIEAWIASRPRSFADFEEKKEAGTPSRRAQPETKEDT